MSAVLSECITDGRGLSLLLIPNLQGANISKSRSTPSVPLERQSHLTWPVENEPTICKPPIPNSEQASQ
jgi:hypothetical protein